MIASPLATVPEATGFTEAKSAVFVTITIVVLSRPTAAILAESNVPRTFDSNKIAAAGLDDTTMVIVTNTADYASVAPVATGSVAKGDAVIEVKI